MEGLLKVPQEGYHWIVDGMKKRIYDFHEGGLRDRYLLSLKGRLSPCPSLLPSYSPFLLFLLLSKVQDSVRCTNMESMSLQASFSQRKPHWITMNGRRLSFLIWKMLVLSISNNSK
jgi:hypothetical protein